LDPTFLIFRHFGFDPPCRLGEGAFERLIRFFEDKGQAHGGGGPSLIQAIHPGADLLGEVGEVARLAVNHRIVGQQGGHPAHIQRGGGGGGTLLDGLEERVVGQITADDGIGGGHEERFDEARGIGEADAGDGAAGGGNGVGGGLKPGKGIAAAQERAPGGDEAGVGGVGIGIKLPVRQAVEHEAGEGGEVSNRIGAAAGQRPGQGGEQIDRLGGEKGEGGDADGLKLGGGGGRGSRGIGRSGQDRAEGGSRRGGQGRTGGEGKVEGERSLLGHGGQQRIGGELAEGIAQGGRIAGKRMGQRAGSARRDGGGRG
jgi:hypothetical protein